VLNTIGARVLERELPVGQAHQAFGADDRLADDRLRTALTALIAELLRTAGSTSHAGTTAA